MDNLKPVFFKNLIAMCDRLGVNPADMLLLFTQESGLDSTSLTDTTVGLNQFTKGTYRNYVSGTREEYAALPPEEQLVPIEAFFRDLIGGRNITSAAQLYCANLLPACLNFPGIISKDRSTIIAASPSKPDGEKKYEGSNLTYGEVYSKNSGLDYNKDKYITYGDIEDFLKVKLSDSRYQWALNELSKVSGSAQSSTLEADSEISGASAEQVSEEDVEKGGESLSSFLDALMGGMQSLMASMNLSAFAALDEENNFLIKISSLNLEDNLEVARILSTAYEDLLSAKCKIYTNGHSVEISCKTRGESKKCFAAVDQFSKEFLNEFKNETKIDGIKLNIFANKNPSYDELNVKTAENNYRKFQLKMLGIKNG